MESIANAIAACASIGASIAVICLAVAGLIALRSWRPPPGATATAPPARRAPTPAPSGRRAPIVITDERAAKMEREENKRADFS